jgi:hypothetical protein
MSTMAMSALHFTIWLSKFSITTWVRSLSSIPINGSRMILSHSSTTGVEAPVAPAPGD